LKYVARGVEVDLNLSQEIASAGVATERIRPSTTATTDANLWEDLEECFIPPWYS
jgi:hypothetical protein